MACPADVFQPRPASDGLELWAPADLEPVTASGPAPDPAKTTVLEPVCWPDAVEVDRVVPPSGNMTIGPQQFWLGTSRTGQQVRFWIDTTTVHLSIAGWRIKTVPSRLSAVDLADLRHNGAGPAGPPPAGNAPGLLAATSCVEVQRLVNTAGIITLGSQVIQVGSPAGPGQRARIRLDGQVMHVITQDGVLWRTLPCPIPPGQRHTLQGVRLAGPEPLPAPRLTIQRKGLQPRRHPGRPPAHPGRLLPRGQNRNHRTRRHHPAGHRPQRRAAHHRPPERHRRDHPVQGLRHPAVITACFGARGYAGPSRRQRRSSSRCALRALHADPASAPECSAAIRSSPAQPDVKQHRKSRMEG
jgi:hypothetical protein